MFCAAREGVAGFPAGGGRSGSTLNGFGFWRRRRGAAPCLGRAHQAHVCASVPELAEAVKSREDSRPASVAERCQFLFCLTKNRLLCGSVRPESGREAPERFLMAPLARIQSEQRRRLALGPSGIRLSDCLE